MGGEQVNRTPEPRAEEDSVPFDNGRAEQGGRGLHEASDGTLPRGFRVFDEVLQLANKLLPPPVPLGAVGADWLADAIISEAGLVEEPLRVHDRAYADSAPWFNTPGTEKDAVEDLHAPHFIGCVRKAPWTPKSEASE